MFIRRNVTNLDLCMYSLKVLKNFRWIVLGLFVMYSMSNAFQWIQFSIITGIIAQYYSVSEEMVEILLNHDTLPSRAQHANVSLTKDNLYFHILGRYDFYDLYDHIYSINFPCNFPVGEKGTINDLQTFISTN